MDVLANTSRKWCDGLLVLAILGVSIAADEKGTTIFGFSSPTNQNGPVVHTFPTPTLEVPNSDAVVEVLDYFNITCLGDFAVSRTSGLSLDLFLDGVDQPYRDASGKCVYRTPVQLLRPFGTSSVVTSFSTMFQVQVRNSFIFQSCSSQKEQLEGLAFIIMSDYSTQGDGGGYLGWLNSTTNGQPGHNFAVELDFFMNVDFGDPYFAHVGINVNNLTSRATSNGMATLAMLTYSFLTIWIEYDGSTQILNVTLAGGDGDPLATIKPNRPLLSTNIDLTDVFQEQMFVGFSGSLSLGANETVPNPFGVGFLVQGWTFNSDGPPPDFPRHPYGMVKRRLIIAAIAAPAAMILAFLIYVICVLHRRNSRLNALAKKYILEELEELGRGPQTFKYKVLSAATKGFDRQRLLGTGGFGSVYMGNLRRRGCQSPMQIAVKRISASSHQGAREFLAEVKIIGRVQHRNLLPLLGWCYEKGELLLVYEYMLNGSLDHHLYKKDGDVLSWTRRMKIISGVATALAYLHREWEQRVIHRDVKSSNVMLDSRFNGRLGDFGLARLSDHSEAPPSSAVLAGTHGYLAPELGHTMQATEKTDVYSFGALVLETATGKRPVLSLDQQKASGEILLLDWVWSLYRDDNLLEAADYRLENSYDGGEMATFLKIGLLCSHPDPDERPTMREVLNIWTGSSSFPILPRMKPVSTFMFRSMEIKIAAPDEESVATTSMKDYDGALIMCMDDDFASISRGGSCRPTVFSPDAKLRSRPQWNTIPLPM